MYRLIILLVSTIFLPLIVGPNDTGLGGYRPTPTATASPSVRVSATATTRPTRTRTPTRTTTGIAPTPTRTPTRTATGVGPSPTPSRTTTQPVPLGDYVMLSWNDLGMHCYNLNFQYLAVLPPYNNLWAQVIKRGDPPQIVTNGIRVEYSFPDNTVSHTKTDFWTYAFQLFGVNLPLDVGLKGKGMAGEMDPANGYFVAEGIPLTEFSDSNPSVADPFQMAKVVAVDSATNQTLATLDVVAPVSTEMHCDYCHAPGKRPGGNQANTELNILARHDNDNGTHLLSSTPVLCASCHGSNALGTTSRGDLPNLSNAMHSTHSGAVPNTLDGCYNCHPGPSTKCLRDVMSSSVPSSIDPNRNMDCIDCHGTMRQVAQNPNPWLNEPRCDTCHTPTATQNFNQNNPLYRLSTGHGGVYCEGCHDSTHAIATSSEPKDALKFIELQGHAGTLDTCTVCHLTQPTGPGPHDN